jgi:hypothetical protein
MTYSYKWLAAWDYEGAAKREALFVDRSDQPMSQSEYLQQATYVQNLTIEQLTYTASYVQNDAGVADQQIASLQDTERRAVLVRPAWLRGKKLLFATTRSTWPSLTAAEAWAATPEGEKWLAHCLGATLLSGSEAPIEFR